MCVGVDVGVDVGVVCLCLCVYVCRPVFVRDHPLIHPPVCGLLDV